jgi:transposase
MAVVCVLSTPPKENSVMAGAKKETYQKRQKEMKRLEKQREKAEKRAARKLEKTQNRPEPEGEAPEGGAPENQESEPVVDPA